MARLAHPGPLWELAGGRAFRNNPVAGFGGKRDAGRADFPSSAAALCRDALGAVLQSGCARDRRHSLLLLVATRLDSAGLPAASARLQACTAQRERHAAMS